MKELKSLSAICIIGATLVAIMGLLGYFPGMGMLGSIRMNYIPMAPSTAISFIVLGFILLGSNGKQLSGARMIISLIATSLVSLFGILEVAGHFIGIDLNFEETFVPAAGTLEGVPIARMSPATGAVFFILGIAVLLLIFSQKKPKSNTLIQYFSSGLGVLVLLISFVFCLAYIYGTPLLYGPGDTIPMALTTALAFLFLSISILASEKEAFPVRMLVGTSTPCYLLRFILPLSTLSVILGGVTVLTLEQTSKMNPAFTSATLTVLIAIITGFVATYISNHIGSKIDRAETDAKQASNKLRKSEDSLAEAQKIAGIGNWDLDVLKNTLIWSDEIYHIFGHKPQELGASRESFMNSVHPDDRVFVARSFEKALNDAVPYSIDHRIVLPDGTQRVVHEQAKIIKDETGNSVRIVGTVQDITESKMAEAKLRASEERWKFALEGAGDGVWDLEIPTREVRFSQRWKEMLGYAESEIADRFEQWEKLVHSEDLSGALAIFQACIEGRIPTYVIEHRLRCKDGSYKWILARGMIVSRDAAGQPLRMVGTHTDITERKQAEETLLQSESTIRKKLTAITEPEGDIGTLELSDIIDVELLQSILEDFYRITGMLGAVLDTSGKILVAIGWQDICTRFHRCNPETNKNCIESDTILTNGVPPGTFKAYQCKNHMWDMVTPLMVGGRHVGNVFIGQFFYEGETPDVALFREQARKYGFDETEYLAALDRVPCFSRETVDAGMQFYSKLAGIISTLSYSSIKLSRTLAERKRVDKERALLEEQYHQAQKVESIGRLAGGVAHDLNNLLTPILGYSEILKDDLDPSDTRRESVEEVLNAGFRARDLVRQLLAFSRKQTLEYRPMDLNIALTGFGKLLQRTIREDIEIEIIPSPDILTIMADIGQIEQVIMNLAVNAQDAMPEGGCLTIETATAELDEEYAAKHQGVKPGTYVMLGISDTGCGMDEETLDQVFEPFFSTKGELGTGLGLSTVYGIVKQHGGNIWGYSEPGKGTTFKVYLPVSGEALIEENPVESISASPKCSETILLVEDNEQVRELAHTILKRQGYTVLVAENGPEALTILTAHDGTVDLLLTDVVMPGMNGRDLFDKVTEKQPAIKGLYMSGYTDDTIAHCGVLDEGTAFIQKPFSVQTLAAKVREVLEHGNG
jgi:PAS domain S-box-containing protein